MYIYTICIYVLYLGVFTRFEWLRDEFRPHPKNWIDQREKRLKLCQTKPSCLNCLFLLFPSCQVRVSRFHQSCFLRSSSFLLSVGQSGGLQKSADSLDVQILRDQVLLHFQDGAFSSHTGTTTSYFCGLKQQCAEYFSIDK